ncbi:hypothetical protein QO004_006253 [Rhizobium mesoamericanum]|uniref:hypothetical protein n=1 Tax=Rhizobium mesoamericanum TaxID=1079800 RepID=UPI002782CF34|nr:hypothetical protein [Rhizobium mesoamericanum]MDQ0564434.1 hypothetical protein [Rhizobium mesoamericanum]
MTDIVSSAAHPLFGSRRFGLTTGTPSNLTYDRREPITIPPLPDDVAWTAMQQARLSMAPNLSRRAVADRHLTQQTESA